MIIFISLYTVQLTFLSFEMDSYFLPVINWDLFLSLKHEVNQYILYRITQNRVENNWILICA